MLGGWLKWYTFDFESGYSIVVDVIALEVAESVVEGEDADVAPVVDVIAAHHRIGVILHPDAGQSVAADLVVLVETLRVIRDVQTDVLAVRDVTAADHRLGTGPTHAHRSSNYNQFIHYYSFIIHLLFIIIIHLLFIIIIHLLFIIIIHLLFIIIIQLLLVCIYY